MDKNEFKAADVQVDDATVARSIAAEEIRVAEQQMRADEAMARSLSGGGGGGGGGGGADGKADDDAEGFGGDRTGSAIVTVVGTVVRPELNVLVVLPARVRFTRCSLLLSLRPRHLCHVPHLFPAAFQHTDALRHTCPLAYDLLRFYTQQRAR